MKRAVLVMLLAACPASGGEDYPTRPGGGGPVIIGGGGGTGDAGIGDGNGDAGVALTGRVCIVNDLRKPISCDTTKDASVLLVSLGTRRADAAPARTGEFTIHAQIGTELVWQVTGTNFITTVMPFGTDNTIPIVPDVVYRDLMLNNSSVAFNAPGQGSVVVRALGGGVPASGVTATSTLVPNSNNVVPLYDADNSADDWRVIGPTQSNGILWFPGVNVTTAPARITVKPAAGASVAVDVHVVEQAITFVTTDLQ